MRLKVISQCNCIMLNNYTHFVFGMFVNFHFSCLEDWYLVWTEKEKHPLKLVSSKECLETKKREINHFKQQGVNSTMNIILVMFNHCSWNVQCDRLQVIFSIYNFWGTNLFHYITYFVARIIQKGQFFLKIFKPCAVACQMEGTKQFTWILSVHKF